jgi:hypothetical protein
MIQKDFISRTNWQVNLWADLLSLFAAVFALGVALYFYRERLFVDAAYYFFHAVNSGFFHIEHGRLVLAFSQLLPLMGLYVGAGMSELMILASLGNALFYIVLALILRYHFKRSYLALGVLLIPLVNQHFLHFSAMMEITYGGALLFPFYALLTKKWLSIAERFFLGILLVLVLTSHPEHFVSVAVLIPLSYKRYPVQTARIWWLLLIALIVLIIKINTFSDYEAGKVASFTGNNHHYSQLFSTQYLSTMFRMLFKEYLFIWVLFAASLIYFFANGKIAKAASLFTGIFGLIILVNSAKDATIYSRYIQSMYSPMVALCLIFVTSEVLPELRKVGRYSVLLFLAVYFVFESERVIGFGNELTQRTAMLEEIVYTARSAEGSKFVIDRNQWPHESYWFSWSVPMELLLLSAEKGPESALSIVEEEDMDYGQNRELVNETTFILRRFETYPHEFLNPWLFRLAPSSYTPLGPEVVNE